MRTLKRLVDAVQGRVRLKLLVLALLPVAVVLPIALAGLIFWGASFTYEQLYIKVNTDLAVAHDQFMRIQQDHLDSLTRLGESYGLRDALASNDNDGIERLIGELQERKKLSYLRLVAISDGDGSASRSWVQTSSTGSLRALRSKPTCPCWRRPGRAPRRDDSKNAAC